MAFSSVDEYIAAQPEAARPVLGQVRDAIRRALPDSDEVISYNMPGYKRQGRGVIWFGAWKKHYSIYPISGSLRQALSDDLAACEVEKGTARFRYSDPVPVGLIERVAKFRADEEAVTGAAAS